MKPEQNMKIKNEGIKQSEAGFLEVIDYLECLANIVSALKKDAKVRKSVDYMDLSKASLKDDFQFPHIDVLVDNTVGHALFSWMVSQVILISEWLREIRR